MMGIDPQLVGSPVPAAFTDFDSDSTSPASSANAASSPEETAAAETITPVKVGGHGKARKGTVASGGIKKASATPNKENNLASNAFMPSTTFKPRSSKGDDEDDDDDLPADWRPPPEVFQKMSSKEKRQLRNKISARNFRVRRKEYISTLEDNIAERDRLLSAIRAELGSTQSENLALRQEIAALKRTLLDNRGPAPVLPPPAPLSSFSPSSPSLSSFSPTLSPTSTTASGSGRASPLPRANPLKDVGASGAFWGGVSPHLGGGYTSVHTARIPELLGANPFANSPFAINAEPHQQQENLNPALNGGKVAEVLRAGLGLGTATGANGDAHFGDANPFTVRSLDAYRMHLWGRMAAQYRHSKEHPAPAPANTSFSSFSSPSPFAASGKGLAGGLRPKYFASPSLPYSASPSAFSSGSGGASGLAASLAGLSLSGKGANAAQQQRARERESQREKERERETAMYAALASQTLLRRLGGAFWEAFSGASPSSSSGASSSAGASGGKWDAEKVRKVLEGRAVVRVVDVEPPAREGNARSPALTSRSVDVCRISDVLEESMRSLNLGKK
ncbi:hypothetical protein DFH09DRAFT_1417887 [Mycena vulgaris]|nr:hypothetical protein DFH09DRAFT_1417887 [Mycena vulgaris]